MEMAKRDHIIKCRDDKSPVFFSQDAEASDPRKPFKLEGGCDCSWIREDDNFGSDELRPRIEPWLTALFQSEHFSLLVGSGLSQAVHRLATDTGLPWMDSEGGVFTNPKLAPRIEAAAEKSAAAAGREDGNIEDKLRVANELLRGLEILSAGDSDEDTAKASSLAGILKQDLNKILEDFSASILAGERGLITAEAAKLEQAFNYLVSFLMSFASRNGTRERLQIFTTNYDRYIEAGAEIAGLHLLDRFVGSLTPIFRSSRLDMDLHYNPPGIRGEPRYLEGVARFSKLHGSLDWIDTKKSIRRIGLPFGAESIAPFIKAPGLEAEALQLMIYPNSAKDRETASYPYVELFRDFAAAICRPNSTLITYGYSFGDEHINRVIEDMLTIPSAHLVIISFGDKPLGRIMQVYKTLGRHAQVTLLIGNHLGDFKTLVDNYLPKPAIDRTTFRMTELLKSRGYTGYVDNASKAKDDKDANTGLEL